jgi:hypothetical protein
MPGVVSPSTLGPWQTEHMPRWLRPVVFALTASAALAVPAPAVAHGCGCVDALNRYSLYVTFRLHPCVTPAT